MVCFQTKNPNLGKFWRALEWKMQVYFVVIWNILRAFGNLWPFGNVVIIWYILPHFGILCHEQSGNPVNDVDGPASAEFCPMKKCCENLCILLKELKYIQIP
jgi:hypothetical protein